MAWIFDGVFGCRHQFGDSGIEELHHCVVAGGSAYPFGESRVLGDSDTALGLGALAL